jgi:hypothetical protein
MGGVHLEARVKGKVGTGEKAGKSQRAQKWGLGERVLTAHSPVYEPKDSPSQHPPPPPPPRSLGVTPPSPLLCSFLEFMSTVHSTKCHWCSDPTNSLGAPPPQQGTAEQWRP